MADNKYRDMRSIVNSVSPIRSFRHKRDSIPSKKSCHIAPGVRHVLYIPITVAAKGTQK